MPDSSSAQNETPHGSSDITSYHAHIYWGSPEERDLALRIRQWIAERFAVALGRVHDTPIGPHTLPMYQAAFTTDVFARITPWLMLNSGGLSVLIHPNTGRTKDDHLLHALWLGRPLGLRDDVLSNDHETNTISAPVVNTAPDRASD